MQFTIAAVLAFAVATMASPLAPLAARQAIPNVSGARDVGNGQGLQFTTAGCVADGDCQEGCCANNGAGTGICSGIGAEFQNGKLGCGFVDPNAAATIAAAQAQVEAQGF